MKAPKDNLGNDVLWVQSVQLAVKSMLDDDFLILHGYD